MNRFLLLTIRIFFLFGFILTISFALQAQNLIPNPSFEDNIACPAGPGETFKAVPWVQPSGHQGTSDYFHICNTSPIPLQSPPVGVPLNLLGHQDARTGDAYCGFFTIDDPNDGDGYREYVQTPLTTPLTAGSRYCVRFYVSLSDLSTNSTNGVGAYFSTQPVSGPGYLPLPYTPQVVAPGVIDNYSGWEEVYGEFVADEAYSYITIGSFIPQGQHTTSGGAPIDPNTIPPTIPMPGAYYYIDDVYVGPANNCPVPCNLQFSNASTVADCNMSNGVAAVTVTGGSGNYTYLWETGETTATLPGVAYGSYEVTVGDGPGCELTQSVFVGQNSSLSLTFSPGFLQCESDSTGTVDIDVTGGTMPYTFLWSTGETTQSLDSVSGGTYTVVVTDADGCMLTDSTELTSIFGSSLTLNITDESCAGANNGSMYVTYTTFPPVSYSWSTGSTGTSITNLAPGTYSVDVTDFFGCVTTLTGEIGSGSGNFSVSISQQGDTLYATTAPNYQWYFNDVPVSGANDQTFLITESGYFYVVASGGGNCVDTSNIIESSCICTNGIEEGSLLENVFVFPNPANENLNVVISMKAPGATQVKLIDLAGRTVWSLLNDGKTTETKYSIPVSSFSEGIYIVQASAGTENKYFKIIIKK